MRFPWNKVFISTCLSSLLISAVAHASDVPGTRLDCRNAKGNKVAVNKNCNDAPVITTTALPNATEGQAYSFALAYTDTHNDAVTWRVVEGPVGMTISAQGVLQWQPGTDSAPSYAVTILVADDMLGSQKTFTLTVNQADIENHAPVITSEPQAYLTENTPWTYAIVATDADGDNLTYTLEMVQPQPPQGLALNSNTLSWTPTYNQAGDHPVKVTVSDGQAEVSQSFILEVANNNRVPQIVSLPVTSGSENTQYSYIVEATDADGDALTYQLTSSPQGMGLVGNTVNWLPGYDQTGSHAVTVDVSDGTATVSQTYTLTVSNTNRAPEVTSSPVTSAAEGQSYTYTVEATDADGDALTYTLTEAPQGMTLTDYTLNWQPGYAAAGTVNVIVTVSDGEMETPHEFTIAVANTNLPPVFTSTPVTSGAEGQVYSYTLTVTDGDNQPLNLALVTAPAGMTLEGATLSWTPGYNQAGSHEVVVSVSDTEITVTQSFTVVVDNTNRAPEFISVPPTQVDENSPYSYTLHAIDPDGQFLSYRLVSAPAGLLLMLDTLQWQPDYQQAGQYTITVAATDGAITVEQTFTLTVDNVNRVPVITSQSDTTTVNEMALYSYTPTATDEDGDALTWQISGEPSGMLLLANTQVRWQPLNGQTGAYNYTLTVSDGGASASQTVSVTVVMLDTDNDTVRDSDDRCADTPAGEVANAEGCALVQLDTDNDGVNDKIDQCAASARFQAIGADGCSDEERDSDGDGVVDMDDASPNDPENNPVPKVTIDSPANLSTLGASPVPVSGTVDPTAQSLTLNGAPVSFDSNGRYATQVTLEEGHNTIIARMVTATGIVSTASVSVSLDKTPPYITIESHQDGQVVTTPAITLTGLINDIVRGTVESEQAYVTVNGQMATIANRSYAAFNVPLQPGANTLTVLAADQAGNIAEKQMTVIYQAPSGQHKVEIVGGQNQSGAIKTTLANPMSVRVLDAQGQPVANKPVVFRVIQGDGQVAADSDSPASGTVVRTAGDGVASTAFRLGQRSGVANNKVAVRVVDYPEQVFVASATPGVPDKLSVNSGNNQYGEVYQPLPAPFVVVATDAGSNVIQGLAIEFSVVKGGGHFGNGQKSIVVTTDSDGRASAHLTAGGLKGFDAQVVNVKLANSESPISAGFSATAFQPGEPGNTTISGIVTDTEETPLAQATIRVDGTTRQAVTGADGKFLITEAPVGPVHLVVDGSTIEGEGEYPTLSYNIVTVSGVDNPLNAPVYMVKLNTRNKQYAGLQDVAVTLDEIPGFKLEIPAGSVTFPDGSKEGYVSVTVVNSSKVPMVPPNGMQPQFIVTIQPTGAMFEPPARMTIPNVDGHAPGRQVEMFSYDHDLEEFVAIGLGTVSKDGKTITSNPGVGVVKAGWHCAAQPGGDGCAQSCLECTTCKNSACQYDLSKSGDALETQVEGNCQKETCGGGVYNSPTDDATQEQQDDCRECKEGKLIDTCEEFAKKEREAAAGITICCKGVLIPYSYPPGDEYTSDTSKTLIQGCTDLHEEYHVLDPTNYCGTDDCGSLPKDRDPECGNPSQAKEECIARQRTVDCLTASINNNDCNGDDTCLSELIIRREVFNRSDNPELANCLEIEEEYKCR